MRLLHRKGAVKRKKEIKKKRKGEENTVVTSIGWPLYSLRG